MICNDHFPITDYKVYLNHQISFTQEIIDRARTSQLAMGMIKDAQLAIFLKAAAYAIHGE